MVIVLKAALGPLRLDLPADPRSPRMARRSLGDWLLPGPCGEEMVTDLALAVSEAVSNSVEHGYAAGTLGTIRVDAVIVLLDEGSLVRVLITVSDDGRWRLPPSDPGYRGRGLPMIAALVHEVSIQQGETGTCVRMTSHSC